MHKVLTEVSNLSQLAENAFEYVCYFSSPALHFKHNINVQISKGGLICDPSGNSVYITEFAVKSTFFTLMPLCV